MEAFKQLAIIIVLFLPLGYGSAKAQSKNTVKHDLVKVLPNLIDSTEAYKESTREVVRLQQDQVHSGIKKLEELRQLVTDGLVARNELVQAEQNLAAMRAKLAAGQQQIADADRLIAQIKANEQIEKFQAKAGLPNSKVKLTSFRFTGGGSWSINNLNEIRFFFESKFGHSLPISAIGQSATHNQLRWDHRNAADVSLHPDSAEGQALISFLKGQGIPFLAFRSAIPGIATGPHIHIGLPSNRLM